MFKSTCISRRLSRISKASSESSGGGGALSWGFEGVIAGERSPAVEKRALPLRPVDGVVKTSSLSGVVVVCATSSYLLFPGEANVSVFIALRGVSGGGGMETRSMIFVASSSSLSDHSNGSLFVSCGVWCMGRRTLDDLDDLDGV